MPTEDKWLFGCAAPVIVGIIAVSGFAVLVMTPLASLGLLGEGTKESVNCMEWVGLVVAAVVVWAVFTGRIKFK